MLGGAMLSCTSCAWFHTLPDPIRVHAWLADPRDLWVVRRVLALPVAGEEAPVDFLDALGENFRAELAASHRFQVVPIGREDQDEKLLWQSERKGRLSVDALVDLGKRFQVDGVLMVRVTSYRPYLPPSLGIQVQLVSVHSGDAVWAVDETFDSGQEHVRQDVQVYVKDYMAPDPSLHETEMVQLSPRRYAQYCSKRIIESLSLPRG